MFNNTKEYMTDRLVIEFLRENPLRSCAKKLRSFPKVQPVLKRANSVKHLGSAVLDSPLSVYAADRIDGAINVADKYVEKYLPSEDHVDCKCGKIIFKRRKKEKNDKKKCSCTRFGVFGHREDDIY